MKKHDISIRLVPQDEIALVILIFSVIHPTLPKQRLLRQLEEMMQQGYQCAMAFHKEHCIGVVGIWIQTKFYVGKHVEYDNFFVIPSYRGKGVGKKLLKFVDKYAREMGCISAELTCDINEHESRKFWEKRNFTPIGLRYQASLL